MLLVLNSNLLFGFGTKYADSFLKFGNGVREISLGGATVSNCDPTSAYYWNPGRLTEAKNICGRFMHSEEFNGILNLDHGSLIIPNYNGYSWGIGFFRSGVDDIPYSRNSLIDVGNDGIGPNDYGYTKPDIDGSEGNGILDKGERLDFGKIGSFGASESAFFISAGKKINKKFSIGLSVKTLYKDLFISSALGLGFDIGAAYGINSNWLVGATISDFTTTYLFWDDGRKEIISPKMSIGTSYKLSIPDFPLTLLPMIQFNCSFDGEKNHSIVKSDFLTIKNALGFEIQIKDRIAMRFGMDENTGYHLGAGIMTSAGQINYGFSLGGTYASLGNSHQIGITLNFSELLKLMKS